LSNGTFADAGLYRVIMTDAYGSYTSSYSPLFVLEPRKYPGSFAGVRVAAPNSNYVYRIDCATNLASPIIWSPVFTNSSTQTISPFDFIDPASPRSPQRFYRAVPLPMIIKANPPGEPKALQHFVGTNSHRSAHFS
jgi:hypothetical protein